MQNLCQNYLENRKTYVCIWFLEKNLRNIYSDPTVSASQHSSDLSKFSQEKKRLLGHKIREAN